MACKANTQHLKLINRLKKIEKYKDDSICIALETWSHPYHETKTKVSLWSDNAKQDIFKGSTMSELERFINEEREKAGLFQEKHKRS